jgi:hypothetical protein
MKTIAPFILLFLFVMPVNVYCQAAETPAQKIKRLEELDRVSRMNADTAILFKLWSDDYVINNPNNTVLTAGQIKNFSRSSGMDSSSFTRNIEKMVFVKDIAIVMGHEIVAPKNKFDNAGKSTTRRFTDVWIKSDTSWQLSARQATNILIK